MSRLTVVVNDENVFEFDKDYSIDEQRLEYFDRMDSDMAKGIKINGELLSKPDSQQRATFVVMNLIKALQQENDAVKTSSCAYLINRFPQLIEVRANDHEDTIKIELIEE